MAKRAGSRDEAARDEYELAVNTQMHFNEILMKFRSFGITVIVAIYSYAISRPPEEAILHAGMSASQWIAIGGVCMTMVLALLDLAYFFQLLLGAVNRSLALESKTSYRLTSAISKAVPEARAYFLVGAFYVAIALAGILLVQFVLDTTPQAAVGGRGPSTVITMAGAIGYQSKDSY